jgi:hypothetical protein
MANFSGKFLDIVAQKLQLIVAANQRQVQKETRSRILLQILMLSENPAFRASMITALRSSGQLESVIAEIANPSFQIDNVGTTPSNKPATYTTPFNVSPVFSEAPMVSSPSVPTTITTDVVKVTVGTSLLAKIVFYVPAVISEG